MRVVLLKSLAIPPDDLLRIVSVTAKRARKALREKQKGLRREPCVDSLVMTLLYYDGASLLSIGVLNLQGDG